MQASCGGEQHQRLVEKNLAVLKISFKSNYNSVQKKGRLGEIDKGGMVALLRQRGPSFLGMLAGNAGSIKQRNHDHDESEAAGAAQL